MLGRLVAISVIAVGLGAARPSSALAQTVTVDTFADSYDGSCADGDCSLRDACASAPDGATIRLPSGFYALTIVEAGGASDGSIETSSDVTIVAAGLTGAFVDATVLGAPAFDISGGTTDLVGLTLFGATAGPGGIARVRAGAALTLDHTTLVGGHGVRAGQVLVAPGGTLSADATLFLDGRASDGPGSLRVDGNATIRDATFSQNRGQRGGAASVTAGGSLALRNVTVTGNRARGPGGGLWIAGTVNAANATIAGNRAGTGGGIALGGAAVSTASHVIVSGNHADRHPQCFGALTSEGHNLERRAGCGFAQPTDTRGVRARLGALRSNGGPTPTRALRAGSPALDVGGTCGAKDQRGVPRRDACDAGAYERVLCRGSVVDIVGTPGDDEFSGGRDPDTFLGLGGDDEFQELLDADVACGGAGADHLIGGPGPDRLFGGAGDDTLDGEGGVDRCIGGPGRDRRIACER